jgi:hypothetical protein
VQREERGGGSVSRADDLGICNAAGRGVGCGRIMGATSLFAKKRVRGRR